MKGFVKFIGRLLIFLLILLLGAIVYLDVRGFPPFLKQFVEQQLGRQGVAARFSSIRLDVLRGVVAKDAVLGDIHEPEQVLARIDELQIDWNWHRLLHAQNAIDALRIANATISVPTPADEIGPEVFKASEAHATFRFEDDGGIQIDQATPLTGLYAGIRVRLFGRIRPRGAEMHPQKTDSGQGQFVFITKALRELDGLHGDQPPQLDVDFDLDLGMALDSRVSAKLLASDVTYRKVKVEKLTAEVCMTNGAIDIAKAALQVGKGELAIHGRYDIAAGFFDLNLDSSLDPNLFLPSLPEEITRLVRDVHVFEPPKISVRYLLSHETGTQPLLRGSAEFGALECRSVPFQQIAFTFENRGADLQIDDAKVVMKEGQLTGHGRYNLVTSDFTYEIDSTLDPRKLLPLMPALGRQIVEPSWFDKPPHIVAKIFGDFVDPDAFGYDATLTVNRCAYRGVSLNSASGTVKVRRSMLEASDMILRRHDGDIRGWLFANFNTHRIAFDLSCGTNPNAVAPLLHERAADVIQGYRFGSRTEAAGKGIIDLDRPERSAWQAHIAAEGFSYWKLTTDKASADVLVTNGVLTIDNFDGEFYEGRLRGRADFALINTVDYKFNFQTEHIEVRKLLAAMSGKPGNSSGSLSGHALVTGRGSDLGSIQGGGKLTIENGVLWEIPIFGIFSHILNDIDNGLGTTKATKADATFTLGEKGARTEDMTVSAGAFTLVGQGKVNFDGKLDFYIEAQLLKSWPGIGQLGWLLGKILKYKIGGTIGDFSYRPVNLPKEFLPHDDANKAKTKDPEKSNAN